MASVDYQNSILWRGDDPLKKRFRPTRDTSKKVTRYFPGQVPHWAREKPEEEDEEEDEDGVEKPPKQKPRVVAVDDAASVRLRRLRETRAEAESTQDRLSRHRVIHEARVLEGAEEEKGKEEGNENEQEEADNFLSTGAKIEDHELDAKRGIADLHFDEAGGAEDDDNERRALARERTREVALLKRKEEEDVLKEELGDDGEDEIEEESEEESDSDDDPRRNAMLKPIFVSKNQRDTVREREAVEKEEEEAQEKEKQKLRERKVETKGLVVEEIRRAEEAERDGLNENDASDIELIDDNDEKNEAEEYELWKIRELKRIKRDKEDRMVREKEIEWIMKRRSMTEEERLADDKRLDDDSNKRDEVKSFNFMQKYYHRGAFFQEKAVSGEEPLYLRDYHEPTEEEKFDKKLLPQAMQLRRGLFGKKGQVKHTHLTDVDTTDMSAAWAQNTKLVQRYQERMAGAKGVTNFERPSGSKA